MSFRGGRGRGRFGGRGGGGFAGPLKSDPFEEFPEIVLPDRKNVKEQRNLVIWNFKLTNFWKTSAYFLEDTVSQKIQSKDIERYSDRKKSKPKTIRDSLDEFLQYGSKNFPKELIEGSKREQRDPKKVRWNPDADLLKLDFLEKREKAIEGRDKAGKEKKEGEEEEEDEAVDLEEQEEDPSDDDYNQNLDFDDDEDDYNMDDGEDEATY